MEVAEDNLDYIFGSDDEGKEVAEEVSVDKDSFEVFEEEEEGINNDGSQSPRLTKKNCLSLLKFREVNLRRLSAPRDSGRKPILLKLPGFMGIVKSPYSAHDVLENELSEITEGSTEATANFIHTASSIRWKKDSNAANGVKSNSSLVQWSDGSWSLRVGREYFDVSMQKMTNEHNYIYGRHSEEGSMECLGKLGERMMIRPFISSNGQQHRKFLTAASLRDTAEVKVKMAVTIADPEKEKQRLIKLEEEKIKQRRKMEAKQRNLKHKSFDRVSRNGLSASFLEEDDLEDEEYKEGGKTATLMVENEDEYEEDFIDDNEVEDNISDEDEEEDLGDHAFRSVTESEAEMTADEAETEKQKNENTKSAGRKRVRATIVDDEE